MLIQLGMWDERKTFGFFIGFAGSVNGCCISSSNQYQYSFPSSQSWGNTMTSDETIDPIKVLEEAAPYVFPGFKIDMTSFDAARKHVNEDIGDLQDAIDNEWKGESDGQ